jgi:hypothetical protein
MQRKQIQCGPKPPMVALLGLFDAFEIRIEILAITPRGAVDALELLVARVAAPVGAGNAHQPKSLDGARARNVRSATEIDPVTLAVE